MFGLDKCGLCTSTDANDVLFGLKNWMEFFDSRLDLNSG